MPTTALTAIDPGPLSSGLVVVTAEGRLSETAHLQNGVLKDRLGEVPPVLVVEQLQSYGNIMGRHLLDTSYWIGRIAQMAEDRQMAVYLVPRIVVRQQVAGRTRTVGDAEVRAYLLSRFGLHSLTGVNPHCVQAYALGVVFQDLAAPYREQYRVH